MTLSSLHILSSVAFIPTIRELSARFTAETGIPVTSAFGPAKGPSPLSVISRLQAGERGDIAFLPVKMAARQIAEGRLSSEKQAAVMRSKIGLCVREGRPVPDISSPEAIAATLCSAQSIGISAAGSGIFFRTELLPRLGLTEILADRYRIFTEYPVGKAVELGEVEVGLQQQAELMQEKGITLAGPLPDVAQGYTSVHAYARKGEEHRPEISAFLDFTVTPQAGEIIARGGVDPFFGDPNYYGGS
ncbi:extracellular solute-binding protein [Agrobacterium tumefaciens str. Cherry 2E-2-2]|nr:extracellular solute-binding protein [Agrobacterium tumefaciens str. Cherry 2E-2-2]